MPITLTQLMSIEQMAELVPVLTERTLKHWLQKNMNGFRDTCSVKIGGKLLLDLSAVERWVEGHKVQAETQQSS